jgi:NADH dehydrogenase
VRIACVERALTERIVVIGGGAGGLELAVRLAKKFRRSRDTDIVLVDRNPTHIWKPLLHEVATGSLNSHHDEASYELLARKHDFDFVLGRVVAIDTAERRITLDRMQDEDGAEILPSREIRFDQLAISVGSHSNDFGIAGVAEYSQHLDTRDDAERFHRSFTSKLHRINSSSAASDTLAVVIVGGGATGVELAAEMHNVVERLRYFGFEHLSSEKLQVSLLEAAPRLLPRLPERIGTSVEKRLETIGVKVLTGTRVARVDPDSVITSEDRAFAPIPGAAASATDAG